MNDEFQKWRERIDDEGAANFDLRAIRRRGTRLRTRRRALLAAPGLAALAGSAVWVSAELGSPAGDDFPRTPAASHAATPGRPEQAVAVTVTSSGYRGVTVSATPLRPAGDPGWMTHDLVFETRNGQAVILGDFRSSEFLPSEADNRLLVADEGCGYGFPEGPTKAVAGACDLVQSDITLAPGERARRSVTLYVGLPGMKALEPGIYELAKEIEVRRPSTTESVRVVIRYEVQG